MTPTNRSPSGQNRNSQQSDLGARGAAAGLLNAVLGQQQTLNDAFAAGANGEGEARALAPLEARDRAFARLMATTVLRRFGVVDSILGNCLDSPLPSGEAFVMNVLRCGVVQLLFLGTPPHAAVDASVRLLKKQRPRMAGLGNAILRRVDREREKLLAQFDGAGRNTPDWLWQKWCQHYGEETAGKIEAAHLSDPPIDVTLKGAAVNNTKHWLKVLEAEALPTGSLRRQGGGRIETWPGYKGGAWWIQDCAAALPAAILISGLRQKFGDEPQAVLDLCAAPGGKTAQLAAAGYRVTSVDRNPARLAQMRDNLARLQLNAGILDADAALYTPVRPPAGLLLDAPCSATGTIRRRPDVPHLRKKSDISNLVGLQKKLLEHAANQVMPGGILVYAVCSLEPEEGEGQIEQFLKAQPNQYQRLPITQDEVGGMSEILTGDGDIRSMPYHLSDRGGLDGFYCARLIWTP